MIIYRDIVTDEKDELLSDNFKIKDVGSGLWEVDCAMITKGTDNIVLAGANPSAEGEDADEAGGEAAAERVLDIVDQFRLNEIAKPSKKVYQADLKAYMKKLVAKLKEAGKSEDEIKDFQKGAAEAAKKILGNFDNYDFYQGSSLEEGSMYVLVNYRDDGVTPYATYWKHGLEEYKV